jgi:hypothetical protein
MGNQESSPSSDKLAVTTARTVRLHVYELKEKGIAASLVGAYHTGIEISGSEYTFAHSDSSASGVQVAPPQRAVDGSSWVFRETIALGEPRHHSGDDDKEASASSSSSSSSVASSSRAMTEKEIRAVIADTRGEFPANTYDLITRNCNHFTETVAYRLGVSATYPSWVNKVRFCFCFCFLLLLLLSFVMFVLCLPFRRVGDVRFCLFLLFVFLVGRLFVVFVVVCCHVRSRTASVLSCRSCMLTVYACQRRTPRG